MCTALCNVQVNLYKTGGGHYSSDVSELDVRVVETFSSQFFPPTNKYDDDAVLDLQPVLLTNAVRMY